MSQPDCLIFLEGQDDFSKSLSALFAALDKKELGKAIRSARGRALTAGRALGAKLAREKYTARSAAIKQRLKVARVSDGGMTGIRFSGSPGLNLYQFMPRPSTSRERPKRGVTVKVKKAGSRHVAEGRGSKPFLARIKKSSPDLGVFTRVGRQREMLFGPSPIQALQGLEYQEQIGERMEKIFRERLEHELEARLAGLVK